MTQHRNKLLNTIIIETEDGAELFQNPLKILAPCNHADALKAIEEIEGAIAENLFAAGYFSYEFGYLHEEKLRPLLPPARKLPLLWFGIFTNFVRLTHAEYRDFLDNVCICGEYILTPPRATETPETYAQKHEIIHNAIKNGTYYQTNFTFKLKGRFFGDELALFKALRARQKPKYGAFIRTQDFAILSLSPELGFETKGDKITCRPMKGTAPIGSAHILEDAKNRAENLMIVDLIRNDLSRIATQVKVPHLFAIEDYETLHQMVSEISAKLKPDTKIRDILAAFLPAGSITGAPKISAMHAIASLEDEARESYCGAIGYFAPEYARFNVAIRTPLIIGDEYEMGVGSGLVYDSIAADEYCEALLKGKFLSGLAKDFALFETLKWEKGAGYIRGARHIERLKKAAQAFGWWRDYDIEKALAQSVENTDFATARVKITIDANNMQTEIFPFSDNKEKWRFCISKTCVNSQNPWLYYKTTNRDFYEGEWQKANEAGADEIIFINENGHLTEGSRTNIFLDMGDGMLLTPPLEAGLLGGILRAELLATGAAQTAILTLKDLKRAHKIYLGNSLRGLKCGLKCGLKPSEL